MKDSIIFTKKSLLEKVLLFFVPARRHETSDEVYIYKKLANRLYLISVEKKLNKEAKK